VDTCSTGKEHNRGPATEHCVGLLNSIHERRSPCDLITLKALIQSYWSFTRILEGIHSSYSNSIFYSSSLSFQHLFKLDVVSKFVVYYIRVVQRNRTNRDIYNMEL
jgi:hypothetical protein